MIGTTFVHDSMDILISQDTIFLYSRLLKVACLAWMKANNLDMMYCLSALLILYGNCQRNNLSYLAWIFGTWRYACLMSCSGKWTSIPNSPEWSSYSTLNWQFYRFIQIGISDSECIWWTCGIYFKFSESPYLLIFVNTERKSNSYKKIFIFYTFGD